MAEVEERLSLDISDALSAVGTLEAALTGSTAGFQSSLDAAVDAFRSQLDSLSSEQITIPVDGDTSGLVESIDAVESSALGAGGGIDALSESAQDAGASMGEAAGSSTLLTGSLEGLAVGFGAAQGGATGLLGTLGKGPPIVAGVAAAIAALVAVTGPYIADAQDARTATDRFNRVLGDMARRVNSISLKGVADDLSALAIAAGADDDTLRITAARLFEVGRSAGIADDTLAATTRQLILLAVRASVSNATLGSASDIIDGLSKGLARGGRFLDQYGVSLTAAEINERALATSGKKTVDQLTQVEKTVAGTALAFERLGDTRIGADIAANLDQPAVKLRSLQTAAKEAGEAAAGDLVDSFVDLRKEAAPLVAGLGVALVGALRLVVEVAQLLTPVLQVAGLVFGGIGLAVNAAVDKLQEFGGFLSGLRETVLDKVPGPLQGVASGLFGLGSAAKDEASPALVNLEEDLAENVRRMQELEEAAKDADTAIGVQLSATMAAFSANEAQRDAQQRYADAIRDTGKASEETRDATIALAERNADLRVKTLEASGALVTDAEKAAIHAEAFRVLAQQTRDSGLRAVLTGIADDLDRIAVSRPSTVVDIETADALRSIANLKAAILGVPRSTVSRPFQTLYGPVQPAAHGGPFAANQLLLVGEEGPELVRFGRSGTVINNTDSRSLGGNTINVYEVGGDPHATAFAVGTELGKAATR